MNNLVKNRITILNDKEIDELYGLPDFTPEEREHFFRLNKHERDEFEKIRSYEARIYFILSLGFFKAKRQFFNLNEQVSKEDLSYVCDHAFPDGKLLTSLKLPGATVWRIQEKIRISYGYKNCTPELKHDVQLKVLGLTRICIQPLYLFKELINYFECNNIIIPGYSFLQDIVGNAILKEERRLEKSIAKVLEPSIRKQLNELLKRDESFYGITFIKREAKDFSNKQFTAEALKRELIKDLYVFSCDFLKTIDISKENIKHYADLVRYYSVYKLNRMSRSKAHLLLACYVNNRYQKINDNFINCFLYYVNKYSKIARESAKNDIYELKLESNRELPRISSVLDLFLDESIPDDAEFGYVRKIAFEMLEKEKFPLVSHYVSNVKFDEKEFEWQNYDSLIQKIRRNLRFLFNHIDFTGSKNNKQGIEAATFLKDIFRNKKNLSQIKSTRFPLKFISGKLKEYILESGKNGSAKHLNVNLYEYSVYRYLSAHIESGDIHVKDSMTYKSLKDDLVDDATWANRDELIRFLGLPLLLEPIEEILTRYENILEPLLQNVHRRIQSGENSHVKIKGKGEDLSWNLVYHKNEEQVNHDFYSQFKKIGIADMLQFISDRTSFLSSFTHIIGKNIKKTVEADKIIACLVAYGTNNGLRNMATMSDFSFNELQACSEGFMSLENLKKANDMVVNKMTTLPIFKHYNIKDEIIHSSSDGQRFETQINIVNSRHLPKYFGLNKGVSSYTLCANNLGLNGKIIGADHESHHVFDILHNNTSNVDPLIHSTDTHGTNEVNFAILEVFGYTFAPRYKAVNKRNRLIYSFKSPEKYKGCVIKPARKLKRKLIVDEWNNQKRIFLSLALRTTTQSTIVRKLSSYKRQNRTKLALWEFDNIIKSIYVLKYIDSEIMRKDVQKAINRGEAYHKLRRAVFYANLGKFKVKTELEQQIWIECNRLVCNAIIFYNTFLLSRLFERLKSEGRISEAEKFARISPIAWRHINLYGIYNFRNLGSELNPEEIINELINQSGY